jgi:hypothetical protein
MASLKINNTGLGFDGKDSVKCAYIYFLIDERIFFIF